MIQHAVYGLLENLPNRFVAVVLRFVVFPYGREFEQPRDAIGHAVVNTLLEPGPARERLTAGVFIPKTEEEPVGALEVALRAVIAAEPVDAKMRAATKAGALTGRFADELAEQAVAKGVITAVESRLLDRAHELRRKVIMVDDFPRDLGKSEIFQTTQPVTFEALRGLKHS